MVTDVKLSNNDEFCLKVVVWTLYSGFLLTLVYKLYEEKHLSLDGINYFYQVLDKQGFANIAWSRRYAEYINLWPLVLAVKAGITSIPFLSGIFATGIFIPYVVFFLICYWSRRGECKSHLIFPLISLYYFNAIADYDLICESHVMVLVSWPILMLLTREQSLTWFDGFILWIMLVIYWRLYETALIPAGIFLVFAGYSFFQTTNYKEKIIYVGTILLTIVTIAIAAWFIFHPRSPGNRGNFLDSVPLFRRNNEAIVTVLFSLSFWFAWLSTERFQLIRKLFFIGALIPIAYYIYIRTFTDYTLTAYISFSSRTFTAFWLPVLLIASLIVARMKPKLNRLGLGVLSLFILVMMGFNAYDTTYWRNAADEYKRILSENTGFVRWEATELGKDPYKDYVWDWNNSLLSIVWSDSCVKSIILNPEGSYQPVKILEELPMKNYIKYSEEFRQIDGSLEVCK